MSLDGPIAPAVIVFDGAPPETEPAHVVNDPNAKPIRKSPWRSRQNIVRLIWMLPARPFWVLFPGLRPRLLRIFGANIGARCRFAGSVEIVIPWNLDIGDDVVVEEKAILYALGRIRVGNGTVIETGAHLCAGTHDMTDPRFPLLRTPITIGARAFIGTDAYVGPNVTLGDGVRVWARASVYRSYEGAVHLRGNPARPFDPDEPDAPPAGDGRTGSRPIEASERP